MFLTNLFELIVDDVIAMTHEKVSSELRLYIQKILIQKREYRFTLIRDFYRHFKKSSDFDQNFIMPMESLSPQLKQTRAIIPRKNLQTREPP